MEFIKITSIKDPLYEEALDLYYGKLNDNVTEHPVVFEQSLENKKTKDDYVFIVGYDNNEVISLATGHYEATTNSAFIIYLIAKENDETIIDKTIAAIEFELDQLAIGLHDRESNFFMFESTLETSSIETQEAQDDIDFRKSYLHRNGYLKQHDLDYVQPNLHDEAHAIPLDLYIKSRIELSKDIYAPSIKSNYILKYVFANKISRSIVYPLLTEMGFRK